MKNYADQGGCYPYWAFDRPQRITPFLIHIILHTILSLIQQLVNTGKINVNLPLMLCIVVLLSVKGEFLAIKR